MAVKWHPDFLKYLRSSAIGARLTVRGREIVMAFLDCEGDTLKASERLGVGRQAVTSTVNNFCVALTGGCARQISMQIRCGAFLANDPALD